jgi:hypothetical protein
MNLSASLWVFMTILAIILRIFWRSVLYIVEKRWIQRRFLIEPKTVSPVQLNLVYVYILMREMRAPMHKKLIYRYFSLFYIDYFLYNLWICSGIYIILNKWKQCLPHSLYIHDYPIIHTDSSESFMMIIINVHSDFFPSRVPFEVSHIRTRRWNFSFIIRRVLFEQISCVFLQQASFLPIDMEYLCLVKLFPPSFTGDVFTIVKSSKLFKVGVNYVIK